MAQDDPPLGSNAARAGRVLVFDSGVGGLTVAQEIAALAPGLAIDYAADTAFFPYGDKSDAALRARVPAAARALVAAAEPDVFVIACNTASTLSLDLVRQAVDIPVVGTVPAIKPAVALSETGTIGLLATPGTIGRGYTDALIKTHAPNATVVKLGSLDLVELAERWAAGDQTAPLSAFAGIQAGLFEAPGGEAIDTVVLACTHFPLVRRQLAASAPRPVRYIDSGEAIARQTLRVLPAAAAPRAGGRVFLTDQSENHPGLVAVFQRFGFSPAYAVPVEDAALGKIAISPPAPYKLANGAS